MFLPPDIRRPAPFFIQYELCPTLRRWQWGRSPQEGRARARGQVKTRRAARQRRHREEAEGRRGDPGEAGRPTAPWIATSPLRGSSRCRARSPTAPYSAPSIHDLQPMQQPALVAGDEAIGCDGDKRIDGGVELEPGDLGPDRRVPQSDRPVVEPEASRPSARRQRVLTSSVCPSRRAVSTPVAAFHTRIVPP